ncbi:asparaginase [Tessaracoccus sp. OS52]|uniref:asparaginase n=1 Tax=Tessaracoccus sp. OS52 TaxID=2886691 RepID=UPI001D1223CF|nr:asparaginase [Tessaracoccus sp. OS52]MCC2591903.1 asparaginase [Tessaracoccus sp. OS52]
MGLEEAPVVAHAVRSGFVESVHRGIGVITSPAGDVEFAVGEPDTVILPRSSNKPIHAVAALRAGAVLSSEALAVGCASHSGEAAHLGAVLDSLAASGLGVHALRNSPDFPLGEEARLAWIRSGRGKESLAQNCSGNHAAMLAACVASGWDLGSYQEPTHPFQRLAAETTEDLGGERVVATAVDGCGAALFAIPLLALARAFGRLAGAVGGPERAVADAMRAHPHLVAGPGRDVTALMQGAPGLIAKDGAEAVYAVGLPDGRGVALKISDGGDRARAILLAHLLRRAGTVDEAVLQRLETVPVLGHGRPVGAVVCALD